MKLVSPGSFNYMGKKTEIITKGKQGILMNPELFFRVKIGQYPPVLSQQPMDIPHIIV
jgi:hypothetical protein